MPPGQPATNGATPSDQGAIATSNSSASDHIHETGSSSSMSPNSKKRSASAPPNEPVGKKSKPEPEPVDKKSKPEPEPVDKNSKPEPEPVGKKSKPEPEPEPVPRFPSPPRVPATEFDKATWQGYCEIESDPAYFSVILREVGIRGTDVQELHMMDPEHLLTLPPIYGLVLLFRHREFDQEMQEGTCPSNVWFANQMPGQNSCATLAMVHTLLNTNDPNIDIGEHMRQFKAFTKTMTPFQRGQTFASWGFVKKIHNSFAKKMDMLENDKYIAGKVAKAEKTQGAGVKKPASEKAPTPQKTSNSRTVRRNSGDSIVSNDSVEAFEENAHHYIAFVPIDGQVWKLDGMDNQPTLIGEYDEAKGDIWTSIASDPINNLIGAGDNDYGIFAITQSPLVPLHNKFLEADHTIKHVKLRLDTLNADWKDALDEEYRVPPSPSFVGSFNEEQRAANPIPGSIKTAIDQEDMPELLNRYRNLVSEMRRLIMECMEHETVVTEQNERAEARRWDYGPAIQAWIGMLAENGFLEENIDLFKD